MSASLAIQETLYFKTTTCITCGCHIALETTVYDWRIKDHENFYCPNGHAQRFSGETPEAKLKRELEAKERALVWEKERVASLNKQLVRTQQSEKRLKKRIAAGVCPCCHRTVKQLAAHMQTKHPEFAEQLKAEAK